MRRDRTGGWGLGVGDWRGAASMPGERRKDWRRLLVMVQPWEVISRISPSAFARSRKILEGAKGSPSKLTRWSTFWAGESPFLARASRVRRDGAEGERGGGGFEFGIVVGGDPVAEIGGAEGEDAAGINARRDAGAGLAALGEERRGGAGVVEEGERLIGWIETLGHASWFERSAGGRGWWGGLGKWLRGWGKSWGWGGHRFPARGL